MNTKGNNAQQITPVAADVINSLGKGCGNPLVAIHCTAYNQEGYIRDALEGFVRQRTEFPFVAIVHDDASTDDTQKIIREYSDKYPDIIVPIIETQNLYSRKDGSITRIMNEAIAATGARYVAYCEGDDYWTDPYKLSKQVAFLEAHPDYSMCFTNAAVERGGEMLPIRKEYDADCDVSFEDIVYRGGGLCPTATILARFELTSSIPPEARKLYVGDWPMQIYMAHRGKVRYIADTTAVYRIEAVGSWTSRYAKMDIDSKKRLWDKEEELLSVMDGVTEQCHSRVFRNMISANRFNNYNLISPGIALRSFYQSPRYIMERYGLKRVLAVHGWLQLKRLFGR